MIIRNNIEVKNEFNISFSILRMYLSFVVVNNHLIDESKFKSICLLKLLKNRISVPIFFIMSFYLCFKLFSIENKKKIMHRLERIIIPYIIWPIIIWVFNNLFHFCLKMKLRNTFFDLKIQLLTGHNFIAALWFQLNLIIITLLMLLIHMLFNEHAFFILINLIIFSYYLQYSNINYGFFSQFSLYTRYPYGRLIEVIPFCISGYFIGFLDIIKYLKKKRIKTLYIIILLLIISIKYNMFLTIEGFVFQGIKLHIISVFIFIIFALNPFEKTINIKNIILLITNYTSGIYYLHFPIWEYLSYYIVLLKKRTIFTSIIIYLTCYFISFIGVKKFGKTKLKHLFL